MLSAFLALASCDNWAVIFTGSRGYGNYRHTADSFYQHYLLVQGGIPKDKTILMNYNDEAWLNTNPFKGHIYRNLEHDPDVFPGNSSIHYSIKNMTARNFYNVLTGNTTNGPALKSNENDNVFVFFDDHGGDGILGVPELCGAYIYADELLEVFQYMYDNKMYKKLFFPITACYAGSVAKYLNDIPNLYIQTASGEDESSYATMYDSKIGDYLTSEYSLYKDEFIEQNPTGTLGELYEYAKEHTEMSHVQEYGDLSLKDMTINEFVGNRDPKPSSRRIRSLYETTSEVGAKASLLKKHSKSYTSLERAEKNVRLSAERACEARLNEIIDGLRKKFVPANSHVDFTKSCERINFPAYRKVLNAVQSRVQVVGETFYEKTFFFSNLCNLVDADLIVSEIEKL